MEQDELYNLVNRISWGKKYCVVQDGNGEMMEIIIRQLSVQERNYAQFLYKSSLERFIRSEIPTKQELMSMSTTRKLWDETKDRRISELGVFISGLVKNRSSNQFHKSKCTLIDRQLSKYKDELKKLKKLKASLFTTCAENLAEERRIYYEIDRSVYRDDDNKFWEHGIGEETDLDLISSVIGAFKDVEFLPESKIRKVARSNYFHMIWVAGGKQSIFGISPTDYTIEQLNLCYWANFYDNIKQIPEGPDDETIDDDEKLDVWLRNYHQENDNDKKYPVSSKPGARREVFILSDAEGAKDVYAKNTKSERVKIQREQQQIEAKGEITDYQLRKMQLISESNKRNK